MRRTACVSIFFVWGVLVCQFPLAGQDSRATLVGVVLDPTGSAVAGAKVTVSNVETGIASSTTASSDGNYLMPLLQPGQYMLRVQHAGFKSLEQGPFELQLGDRVRVDLRLTLGDVTEQISVTAQAPLVESGSADRGQVIDYGMIREVPLNSGNPYWLLNVAPGAQYNSSFQDVRPHDNGAIDQYSINGGRSGANDYNIDGVANSVTFGGRSFLAYVPPAEATQEFKAQTSTYDAQFGRTSGGVISLSIKPGTNKYHFTASEYMRRTWMVANSFANNANNAERPERAIDRVNGTFDGPVRIPKVYDGRNRTFFMFTYEHQRDGRPAPQLGSVPTLLERAGDYSQSRLQSGALAVVYDPATSHNNPAYDRSKAVSLSNLSVIRDPFTGNVLPKSRMDPVALQIQNDYPQPNRTGNAFTNANNYFTSLPVERNKFGNWISRVDHNISEKWKIFGRWNYSRRYTPGWDKWGNDASRGADRLEFQRRNDGFAFDAVGAISARTIVNFRIGFTRFLETTWETPTDSTFLGWPASLRAQMQEPGEYPNITFDNYSVPLATTAQRQNAGETYSAQANLTRTFGKHALKSGLEFRLLHTVSGTRALANGAMQFRTPWTSVSPVTSDPNSGNAWATMQLGYVSGGSIGIFDPTYTSYRYPAAFIQDDWQVSRRLTLNAGLRWDFESPPVERFNRQNRGFAYDAPSPISVPGLTLKGGLLYAGVDGQPRGAFDPTYANFQPRLGAAYKLFSRRALVLRGGFGRYYVPTGDVGSSVGFSQTTSLVSSTATYDRYATISNPFPDGLTPPMGASRGTMTQMGDSITFNDQFRLIPNVWQFSGGFQLEIRKGLLLDTGYVASRSNHLQVSRNIDFLPMSELLKGTTYLNQTQPNPFYNVLPRSTPRGANATTQLRNLLIPYPQYSGLTAALRSLGEAWYNSLQVRLQQRFTSGLSLLVTYTFSKNMEALNLKSPQDAAASRELSNYDMPHRLVLTGAWELPFGPGQKFLGHGLAGKIVGGWQIGWMGIFQSGFPIPLPDYYITRDPRLKTGQTLSRWFDTSADIWVPRPSDTLRTSQFYSPNIRRYTAPQVDLGLTRNFRITERQKFQVKASAFNATNTPIFTYPDNNPASRTFGIVPMTPLYNQPRNIELGFRYTF